MIYKVYTIIGRLDELRKTLENEMNLDNIADYIDDEMCTLSSFFSTLQRSQVPVYTLKQSRRCLGMSWLARRQVDEEHQRTMRSRRHRQTPRHSADIAACHSQRPTAMEPQGVVMYGYVTVCWVPNPTSMYSTNPPKGDATK